MNNLNTLNLTENTPKPEGPLKPADRLFKTKKERNQESAAARVDTQTADETRERLAKKQAEEGTYRFAAAKKESIKKFTSSNVRRNLQDFLATYKSKKEKIDKTPEGKQLIEAAFEAGIDYMIQHGADRCESAMFFLLAGKEEGLISAGRISHYEEYKKDYPAIAYFLKSGEMGEECAVSIKAGQPKEDFNKFFWSVVINHESVQVQVKELTEPGEMQNDSIGQYSTNGNLDNIKKQLESGMKDKSKFIQSMYFGTRLSIEHNGLTPNIVKTFLYTEGILEGKALPKDKMVRASDFETKKGWSKKNKLWDEKVRVPTKYSSTKMTVAKIRKMLWKEIAKKDAYIAKFLQLPDKKSASQFPRFQKHMQTKYQMEVSSLEDFYGKLDEFTGKL